MSSVANKDGTQPLKVAVTTGASVAQLSSGGQSSGSLLAHQQVCKKKKKSCLFWFVRQFSGNLILLPVSCFCFHTHNRHSCKWLYNAKCRCNCSKKWPPNRRVNRPTANPAPLCLAACLSALLLFIFSLWSILFCFSSLPDSLTTFARSQ